MREHSVTGAMRESLDSRLLATKDMLEDPECKDEHRSKLEQNYFQTLNMIGRLGETDKFAYRLFQGHVEWLAYYNKLRGKNVNP